MKLSEYHHYPFLLELMGYTFYTDESADNPRWCWFSKEVTVEGSRNLITEIKIIFDVMIDDSPLHVSDGRRFSYEMTEVSLYEQSHGIRLLALENVIEESYEDLLELETYYSERLIIHNNINRIWNAKYRNEYLLLEKADADKTDYVKNVAEFYVATELHELLENVIPLFDGYSENDKDILSVKKMQTLIRCGEKYDTEGTIILTLTDLTDKSPFSFLWEIGYEEGSLYVNKGKPNYSDESGNTFFLSSIYPSVTNETFDLIFSLKNFINEFYEVCITDYTIGIEDNLEKMIFKKADE